MGEFFRHSAEWLGLVLPASAVALLVGWLWRLVFKGWQQGSWLKFVGAYLGGAISIVLMSALATIILSKIISTKITQCAAGPAPYDCYQHELTVAYPVFIGVIAFGLFIVGALIWRIACLIRARTHIGVSS